MISKNFIINWPTSSPWSKMAMQVPNLKTQSQPNNGCSNNTIVMDHNLVAPLDVATAARLIKENKLLIQCYKCKGWGHTTRNCPTWLSFKGERRKKEIFPTGECNSGFQSNCSQFQSGSSPSCSRSAVLHKSTNCGKEGNAGCYHNPFSLFRLIREANESQIINDDEECPALVDSSAQMSTITSSFSWHLGLRIHTLNKSLEIEGTEGVDIPH